MTFKEYLKEYNKLLSRKIELMNEMANVESALLKDLVDKAIKDINNQIKEFEDQKLYDKSHIQCDCNNNW